MVRLPTYKDLGGLPRPGVSSAGGAPQIATPRIRVPNIETVGPGAVPDFTLGAKAAEISARGQAEVARGIGDLAQGLQQAAVNFQRAQDKADALDAIKANAAHDIALLDIEQSFDDYDGPPETFGQTFDERYTEARNASLETVRNGMVREELDAQFSVSAAKARARIEAKAQGRQEQIDYNDFLTSLDSHRTVYLNEGSSTDQKIAARQEIEESIDTALDTGIITGTQAFKLKTDYVRGIAKEDAEILLQTDPEQLDAELRGVESARRALKQSESGGDHTALNNLGYAGYYQFGAPRLVDIGFYTPGKGEKVQGKWGGKKWSGEFNIPGFEDVKTLEDFLSNPEAQEAAFDAHVTLMDEEIARHGLGQYEGQTVDGVGITREGLYAMLHLGGVKSTKSALSSDGRTNPSDANGTTVLDYAAMAGGYSRFAGLDPVQRSQYRVKATEEGQYNSLLVNIADGNAGMDDIEQAREQGWLRDYDKIQKAYGAVEAYKKQNLVGTAVSSLTDDFKVWDPTDSEDLKMLDALIEGGNGKQRLAQRDDEYLNQAILPLIDRTGIIPKEIKGTIKSMLRSSNPDDVVFALSTMDLMEMQNPEAFATDMGEDALKKVLDYRNDLSFRNKEDIVERIRRSEDPSMSQARKDAEAEGRKLAADVSDGVIIDHFDPSIFVSGPSVPLDPLSAGQLRQEFERLYAQEYSRSGDPEIAQENALKLLDTVWGQTEVGGEKRLMRYPPEKHFAPIDSSYDWIKEQAETKLRPILDGMGAEAFTLIADAKTQGQIAQGQRPSYQVVVKTKDGTFEAIPNTRITFDSKSIMEKRRKDFAKAQKREVMIRDADDIMREQELIRARLGM